MLHDVPTAKLSPTLDCRCRRNSDWTCRANGSLPNQIEFHSNPSGSTTHPIPAYSKARIFVRWQQPIMRVQMKMGHWSNHLIASLYAIWRISLRPHWFILTLWD